MKAATDTQHYDNIAKALNYTKSDVLYKSDLTRVREEIALDNDYFEDIGEAIVAKDGGEMPDKTEMADRIEALPVSKSVSNSALILWDWEGTKLAEYSAEDALTLTELPVPNTLPVYADVDHELLLFQSWNWSLANIKTWIQNHEGATLDIGAIYTTTDGQDHNFWNSPRLDTVNTISMQKRGTASIGSGMFQNCYSLTHINIPDSVTNIDDFAFSKCYSLTHINIPDGVTAIDYSAFSKCYSLTQINIPDSVTRIGNNTFLNCYSLTQIKIPDSVTSIGNNTFLNCYSLTQIKIPDSGTSIGDGAFKDCKALCDILLESKPTLSNTNAFDGLPSIYRIYVPRSDLSWFETETNWATIYTQNHIVAIEDYIEYLESLGFNVDKYKEVTA